MATRELKTQILIVGGSTGGVAAALAALEGGAASVLLTESTAWIGGQFTSQFVPPDENAWVEGAGSTRRYKRLRDGIRQWYRDNRPLTDKAKADKHLNPGGGRVSRLCHEPAVSLAVMEQMLQPYRQQGKLTLLLRHVPVAADVAADRVRSVTLRDLESGHTVTVSADYVLDATELGDLLPLARAEYVTGAESQAETGEPHAVPGPAQPGDVQGFTWCFPIAWDPAPGASHIIDKPQQWERWRDYVPKLTPPWPGKLLSWTYANPRSLRPHLSCLFPDAAAPKGANPLWLYRRVVRPDIYQRDHRPPHEVTLVNWPQNDYWDGNVVDQPADVVAKRLDESRQLSLSLMYWLQTQAPRPDGGTGYPGLYLRPDLTGTPDGLAMAPYVRESRRIRARFTITEHHVGAYARFQHEDVNVLKLPPGIQAAQFPDSVGVGYYRIDLHPSTAGRNYIDIASLPFQIPLGALVPQRLQNLLAACKNIGTTHITNGCYRLHPVEWNVGESAGALAAFCLAKKVEPKEVHEKKQLLEDFQALLSRDGVTLAWRF